MYLSSQICSLKSALILTANHLHKTPQRGAIIALIQCVSLFEIPERRCWKTEKPDHYFAPVLFYFQLNTMNRYRKR